MAIIVLHPRTRASSRVATTVSTGVLGFAVATAAFDLLALLQHDALFVGGGLAMVSFAAAGLMLAVVHQAETPWLWVALLAFGASAAGRLVGLEAAPFVSVLGIVALGLGGAFRDEVRQPALAAVPIPVPVAATASEPTPLRRAA